MWTPKIPFAYNDSSGNSIHFTLDDYVEIFEPSAAEWSSGVRSEISSLSDVPLLREKEKFEAVRRTVIVHSVQEDLAYYIQRHNNIAAGNGISYTFTFPLIDQEDWANSINDIGMMAFIQGIPLGDKTYNHYALGGGRLLKAPVYYGSVDSDGMRYYFREDCRAPGERREVFSSAKEAAAAGYIERTCIGTRDP